jgi:hypothetical protein
MLKANTNQKAAIIGVMLSNESTVDMWIYHQNTTARVEDILVCTV